jgi:hypothetical protein
MTDNKSILKCTVTKSSQVFKKIVLYVSYAIAGLAAATIAIYGAVRIYDVVAPVIITVITAITTFLFGIPWYWYVGIAGISAIPVYSLLWCIARELTKEDWESDAATNFAVLALLALLAALAAPAAAVLAAALLAIEPPLIWYYIFRFPGALWHHYRRREGS